MRLDCFYGEIGDGGGWEAFDDDVGLGDECVKVDVGDVEFGGGGDVGDGCKLEAVYAVYQGVGYG